MMGFRVNVMASIVVSGQPGTALIFFCTNKPNASKEIFDALGEWEKMQESLESSDANHSRRRVKLCM